MKKQSNQSRPTLKTISELSGMAVATVSRALLDAPDISIETKKKVKKIANEIGYVPNRAGVRLRTGRTNVIALVTPAEHNPLNHSTKLISSIADELRGTRFHLNVSPWFPGEDPMRVIRYIVETHSADAIIFNTVEPNDPRVDYLLEKRFPFAAHGRSLRADEHPYFDFDNAEFTRLGLNTFAQRGRKSILGVLPPASMSYAAHMRDGSIIGAKETGLNLSIRESITSDATVDEIKADIEKCLRENPDIDGIITGSTIASLAAATGAEAVGRTIGRDIDIFSREAFTFLKLFRPEILTIPEDVGRAGSFVARAVLQALLEPELPPLQGLEVPTIDYIK